MPDTMHWTDRLWEQFKAAQREEERLRQRFESYLTDKQLDAYHATGKVPKTEKHQRNFNMMIEARSEKQALRKRWDFTVIEGEAV